MSSLCPGTLFSFPGFNKKSTPVPPQTTSEELSKRYRRQPFNGRPWPHGSPVAGVYDVEFSSTKMILFNNKRRQSKLRGNNDPKKEESFIFTCIKRAPSELLQLYVSPLLPAQDYPMDQLH
ncbi:uncharacterized protein LOC134269094 isoform X2 [Saccostrea cucullata]|uniref:uncharacterized protein LOC134269094 isoform X2 n=1 Tax=Saccostrea cuccullata TaxID=36930 RepID=UPI002ED5675B